LNELSSAIVVSSTTNLVYVAYTDSETISVIDGSNGDILTHAKVSGIPYNLDADPNSAYVYVSTHRKDPKLWNNTLYQIYGAFNRVY
jgi:DNA-binding beta-propeller fold protein YncE